ncbi:MAG: hypothetical protein GYA42_04065 [Syntrophomonadaceae bacterium]|nr:hypothetical protein [Syntrophomonadaceae bacterium]
MLYRIAETFPDPIIFQPGGPCLSLYQTTHRYPPDNKQDQIKFRNFLRSIENTLKEQLDKASLNAILEPLFQLDKNQSFWNRTLDGMAVLASPQDCVVYRLSEPTEDRLIVGDSFHIKPLLRHFQSGGKYHLLALSRDKFSLYEGSKKSLDRIEIAADIPVTLKEVLGDDLTEPHLGQWSTGSGGKITMFHGKGSRKDQADIDTERFFKYVDKFVGENFSQQSRLPLILVSTAENQGLFRKISRNTYLVETDIKSAAESLGAEQMKAKAWELIEPMHQAKVQNLIEAFGRAKANAAGSDDIEEIAQAAVEKRVHAILVEADRIIGKIDISSGKLIYGDMASPVHEDILDDLAEMVLRDRGEVLVLSRQQMPTDTGAAAIFR